ncbi:MAG: bifunctional 2-polyprenyl-6-hydroxyphenol methylase/3-demethylubiquinol 3-O-methyltransferase UbiG [Pseudomonadota bacterium]
MNKDTVQDNVDAAELEKFDSVARKWWDRTSEFKPLHDINPLRLGYITDRVALASVRALDVGCGGGILTESLAAAGARVTGIDMADKPLTVARLHAVESGLADQITYEKSLVEAYADAHPGAFDVVTCLELLEHVPDPASVIDACARLLKPGGHLFLSTINRNPKAYALAVIGAEYVLGLLTRGTHDYARFIKPSELAGYLRSSELLLCDITGMTYNPLTRVYRLGRDTDVNYLVHARKPAGE